MVYFLSGAPGNSSTGRKSPKPKLLECPRRMGPATGVANRKRTICPRRSPMNARLFASRRGTCTDTHLGVPNELDFDLLSDPSPLKLAADLLSHRLAFALFATSKVMARRDVRRHRLPDIRRLAVESRWRRNSSIERDEAHLPLVGVRACRRPRHVARGCEQDRLLLVGIERARAPPDKEARRLTVLAPRQELRVAMAFQRLVVRVLAGHVGDRLAHIAADARPGGRSVARLEPQQLAEHGPTKPRRESHDRARIRRDVPADARTASGGSPGRCTGTRLRSRAAGRGGRTA